MIKSIAVVAALWVLFIILTVPFVIGNFSKRITRLETIINKQHEINEAYNKRYAVGHSIGILKKTSCGEGYEAIN